MNNVNEMGDCSIKKQNNSKIYLLFKTRGERRATIEEDRLQRYEGNKRRERR